MVDRKKLLNYYWKLIDKIAEIINIMCDFDHKPLSMRPGFDYHRKFDEINEVLQAISDETGYKIEHPNKFTDLTEWRQSVQAKLNNKNFEEKLMSDFIVNPQEPEYRASAQAIYFSLLEDSLFRIRLMEAPQEFNLSFRVLHPTIVRNCKKLFKNEHYEEAVLNSMKLIEEEIREKIKGASDDIGIELVEKAMKIPNDGEAKIVFSNVKAEQDAARFLFRGAIGYYKNPNSHRFTGLNDPIKAFKIIVFASLLLETLNGAQVNTNE
jgi:uncharacterized protein (TIGR02391 family)